MNKANNKKLNASCKSLLAIIAIKVMMLQDVALAQYHTGDPTEIPAPQKNYSPCVERTAVDSDFAEGVYWGDTHLHTSYTSPIWYTP